MADYFTNFSVIINLKEQAQIQYALDLAQLAADRRFQDDQTDSGLPARLIDVLENWHFETEQADEGIWLHSDSGGVDAVCAFIQHLLQKFCCADSVAFEWSHDCSQPRTDAYGGGAAIITINQIKTMTTSDWLRSNEKST